MTRAAAWPILAAESGLTRYLEEIRRFPMSGRQEEYMLAKRWREDGDRNAAHLDESLDQEMTLAASEDFDKRREALSDALGILNERDRRIFEGRRLVEDPITLAELADEFGVSGERVRQIEARAFEKVQKAVKNHVAAIETPVSLPMH